MVSRSAISLFERPCAAREMISRLTVGEWLRRLDAEMDAHYPFSMNSAIDAVNPWNTLRPRSGRTPRRRRIRRAESANPKNSIAAYCGT
jgi:hypothetical protein